MSRTIIIDNEDSLEKAIRECLKIKHELSKQEYPKPNVMCYVKCKSVGLMKIFHMNWEKENQRLSIPYVEEFKITVQLENE